MNLIVSGCGYPATLLNLACAPSCEPCFFGPTSGSNKSSPAPSRPVNRRAQTSTANLGGFAPTPPSRNIAYEPARPKASFASSSSAPSTPTGLPSPSVANLASRFTFEPASPSISLPPRVPSHLTSVTPSRSSYLIDGEKSSRALEIRPLASPSRTSSYLLSGPKSPSLKDPYAFLPNLGPPTASSTSIPTLSTSSSLTSALSSLSSGSSLASVETGHLLGIDNVKVRDETGDKDEGEEEEGGEDWSGELKLEDLLSELEGGKWDVNPAEEKEKDTRVDLTVSSPIKVRRQVDREFEYLFFFFVILPQPDLIAHWLSIISNLSRFCTCCPTKDRARSFHDRPLHVDECSDHETSFNTDQILPCDRQAQDSIAYPDPSRSIRRG